MQREELISSENVAGLLVSMCEGKPVIYEAYSKYDNEILQISGIEELKTYIDAEVSNGNNFIYLSIYYPDSKGRIETKKIDLNPEKCNGATKRYSIEGWGLIHLQMDYKNQSSVKCKVAVNTEKRANAWSITHPELGAPSEWQW